MQKIFLDENIPLQLHEKLIKKGYSCKHIITEQMRGANDSRIVDFISGEGYIFITSDDDFCDLISGTDIILLLSRVPQQLLIKERVSRWCEAVENYIENYRDDGNEIFEILPDGILTPRPGK